MTDNGTGFFGDGDRLARRSDSSEYLVWQMEQAAHITLTVYAKETLTPGKLRLSSASDRETWMDIPYEIVARGTSDAGWTQYDVHAYFSDGFDGGFLRLEILEGSYSADGRNSVASSSYLAPSGSEAKEVKQRQLSATLW